MSSNEETVECPKCGERIRLTPEQADYDELIVNCPRLRERFDVIPWPVIQILFPPQHSAVYDA